MFLFDYCSNNVQKSGVQKILCFTICPKSNTTVSLFMVKFFTPVYM